MEAHLTALLSFRSRLLRLALAGAMLLTLTGSARAQATDPNPGAVTLTAGIDFPSVYFFRGIRQEAEPKLTTFAFGDVGIALFSGDGGLKSAGVNFGVWNSLHTGSSGSDVRNQGLHYEEDFYASLALGFGGGVTVTPTFTAYTSPNGLFATVQEISLKVAHASKFAPYGLLAFEVGGPGQADGGHTHIGDQGVYAEFGAGPSWPLGGDGATVAVPVKVGLSLANYYETSDGKDHKFGYFDIGALFTVPFTTAPTKFGTWNLHGGVNVLSLGDGTKQFNVKDGEAKGSQVIGSVGIGMTY